MAYFNGNGVARDEAGAAPPPLPAHSQPPLPVSPKRQISVFIIENGA